MKIWRIIFYILAVIPWTFIASLLTFYLTANHVLGYPPTYNNPDPGKLSIYKVYAPYVDWTANIWLYSLVAWFILTIIYLITMRKRIEWLPPFVSGTGQYFGILLLFSRIFEWYID